MRWTGKTLLWLVVALLVLAVIGAIYQAIATEIDQHTYCPPPAEMVDIGDHNLHINCLREGSPPVILEAANFWMSASWIRVQQQVAKATRVYVYDRGGMGWILTPPLDISAQWLERQGDNKCGNNGG